MSLLKLVAYREHHFDQLKSKALLSDQLLLEFLPAEIDRLYGPHMSDIF
jgi:hypothetical protein